MRAWEIDEANVIGRAVRLDEIPPKFRQLELLGRGATAIVYKKDETTALIFTRDDMKREWLVGPMGLQLGRHVDEFEVRGVHKIRGMWDKPITVIEMPLLRKLSPPNAKIVRKEMKQWNEIWMKISSKHHYKQRGLAMQDVYNYYTEHLPDSLLLQMLEFAVNYDENQYYMDLGIRNFLETGDGQIVVIDPLVDKELVDLITDSKSPNKRW